MATEPWHKQAVLHRANGNTVGAELLEAVARHDETLVAAISKVDAAIEKISAPRLSPEAEAREARKIGELASTYIDELVRQGWARQAMAAQLQGALVFAAGMAAGMLLWWLR